MVQNFKIMSFTILLQRFGSPQHFNNLKTYKHGPEVLCGKILINENITVLNWIVLIRMYTYMYSYIYIKHQQNGTTYQEFYHDKLKEFTYKLP